MADLRSRALDPEWLDLGVPAEEARRSLADLRFVNRWLGARASLRRAVLRFLPAEGRLLDVGCGSADVPAWLGTMAGPEVSTVGLDRRALHLREAPAGVRRVVGDVRGMPFGRGAFDVVTASLFLHHFDAPELASVVRALWRVTRRALVVSDLHRARVPYVFGRAAFPLLFRSRVSVSDGLLSIRRGFRPEELRRAFLEAGVATVQIRRRFPYRLLAVATRGAAGEAARP